MEQVNPKLAQPAPRPLIKVPIKPKSQQAPAEAPCTCSGHSTTLSYAANEGCVGCARKYLGQARKQNSKGKTALMIAAAHNDVQIAQLLIPAEIGMRDVNGMTALMYAIQSKSYDVAKMLIEAEGKIKDNAGILPIQHVIASGDAELLSLFMQAPQTAEAPAVEQRINEQPDRQQPKFKRQQCEDHLQKNGPETPRPAPGNAQSSKCPCKSKNLFEAANACCTMCAKRFFVQAGRANPKKTTAMMTAAYCDNVDVARMLVNKERSMQNQWGQTALMIALQNSSVKCVKLLKNVEGDLKDIDGAGAVDYALKYGSDAILKLFSKELEGKHYDPDNYCICSHVSQSLEDAAVNKCVNCARKYISEAGRVDASGMTALMLSVIKNVPGISELLLAKEARLKDSNGLTALHYALKESNLKALKLLYPVEGDIAGPGGETVHEYAVKVQAKRPLLFYLERFASKSTSGVNNV